MPELERDLIVYQDEITAIVQKRSEFEITVNTPGSHPSNYIRYVDYEVNLEALRRKRVQRLGIKGSKVYSGQKRIFSIFDRATKKFPGDLPLWMHYLQFCHKNEAYKKLDHALTRLLRLHPTKPELWIYAAQYELEANGSISAARLYLQRGLRFCERMKTIWIEYAKLEMTFIAKIEGRRMVFRQHQQHAAAKNKVHMLDEQAAVEDENSDMLELPKVTMSELAGSDAMPSMSEEEAAKLENSPLLSGAIPIAVFDSAMAKFDNSPALAEEFFCMFFDFIRTPCAITVLEHVAGNITAVEPASEYLGQLCQLRLSLIAHAPSSDVFPSAFSLAMGHADSIVSKNPSKSVFVLERLVKSLHLLLEMHHRPQPQQQQQQEQELLSFTDHSQGETTTIETPLLLAILSKLKKYTAMLAKAESPSSETQKLVKKAMIQLSTASVSLLVGSA